MLKKVFVCILRLAVVFAMLCSLFMVCGIYTFSYRESLGTFYYTGQFADAILMRPGGAGEYIALFLTQFSVCPYGGVVVTAALLTLVAWAAASLLARVANARGIMPLGLLPAFALAFLYYNVNFDPSASVAMLATMVSLRALLIVPRGMARGMAIVSGSVVMYLLFGPAALLLALLSSVIMLVEAPRDAAWGLAGALGVYITGWISVHSGIVCDLQHALTPEAYYTHRLAAPSIVWMPWAIAAATVAVACLVRRTRYIGALVSTALSVGAPACALGFAAWGAISLVDRQNEVFKQMCYQIGRGDYYGVIETARRLPMTNLLHQNCLNLALAEQGRLADELFTYPCYDIRSIYIEGEKQPYMKALLSDIYWSMGHVSLARRNAFEANESLDNISPRLLQRLAETNIAAGRYAVARKYLNLLSHTMFYSDWAADRMRLLDNDAAVDADPVIGGKRRCIFPDDRFAASRGLDDDLKHILRANPDHRATLQYLGGLYLLSKDLGRFSEVVDEFYGPDSTAVLPQAFAEGMIARYSDRADSIAARYGAGAALDRYREFTNSPNSHPDSFWFFYKFRN